MSGPARLPIALPEPLLREMAPLALDLSHRLCRHVGVSGQSCAAYHGIWQYLRLLDIINPPAEDVPFLATAVGAAARRGARRVLISGCADYAVPAVIQWACAQAGVEADITVHDVCETPLRLCAFYAARMGLTFRIVQGDILDYRPKQPYELVCTHSFLGLFSPAARRNLLTRWREMLVPGGAAVTVNRLAPAGAPEIERFSAEQARSFRELFMATATGANEQRGLCLDVAQLAALAERFIADNAVYAVRSEDHLRQMFEEAGFRIERLALRKPPQVKLSGPTQGAGLPVAQLVATRP